MRIRNKLVAMLTIGIITLGLAIGVEASPIELRINNQIIKTSSDPIIKNSRTLVPLRSIFEALGAEVNWDNKTQTVTGALNEKVIKLQINNKVATVNGKKIELDIPGEIINGSTFVPVRFVSESLGANVEYRDKTVFINTKDKGLPIKQNMYRVIRVVDGDTFILNYKGKEERVRLIGVDTPESVHANSSKNVPEGKIASNYTKNMIEGKDVEIEFDVQERDKYGRLLAYVYLGDVMINEHLIETGYGRLATFPPNVKYVNEFTKLQTKARESNKGFWKDGVHSNDGSNMKKNSEQSRKMTGKLIGSIQSDKFHKPSCRWAKSIKQHNETWFADRNEAIKQGYAPCGTCKP